MQRRDFLRLTGFAAAGLCFSSSAWAQTAQTESLIGFAQERTLVFMRLDGTIARRTELALPAGSSISYLSAASNGQRLAFAYGNDIYTANADGTELKKFASKDGTKFLYPAISPDGQLISARPRRVGATLFVLSPDGSTRDFGPETIEATVSRFSRDGKTIYYANGPHLFSVSTAGGTPTTIKRGSYIQHYDLGPDDRIVVAAPYRDEGMQLGIVSSTGVQSFGIPIGNYNSPQWSPDGKAVVYTLRPRYGDSPAKGIYIYDLQTGTSRQISDLTFNSESHLIWI